jgi:hypothetical protein
VDEARVRTALEEIRAGRPTPTPGEKPDREEREAAIVTALAEKLDFDRAVVQRAFADLRAEHDAERAADLKARLDGAVQAGTLTQAEADAVRKAVDQGVIRLGPGPR